MTTSIAPAQAATQAIRWDPAAEVFVRLTLDPCGRILARADLEPVEKRVALRHVLARTTRYQRQAIARLFMRVGLPLGAAAASSCTAKELNQRFQSAAMAPDIAAFAECLEVEIRSVLVLAWVIGFARAGANEPVARLEELDADLPYVPPLGPPPMEGSVDLDAILDDADGSVVRPAFRSY